MRLSRIFHRPKKTASREQDDRSGSDVRVDSRADSFESARGSRPQQRRPRGLRPQQRGFASIGGCLALLATIAGAGLYRYIQAVRSVTQTQVNLDKCSGNFIIKARAASISMEKSYERVQKYQVATEIAILAFPPQAEVAVLILKEAMTFEKLFEEGVEAYWREQQLVWNTEVAVRCEVSFATLRSSYPSFPYPIIDPALGVLEQSGTLFLMSTPKPIVLWLRQRNLRSAAELKRRAQSEWTIRWTE